MSASQFSIKRAGTAVDAVAPDGSEVRILCATTRGSMAVFSIPPGAVSKAVAHRIVEEIWYFTRGNGRFWLHDGSSEEIVEAGAGVSIAIPPRTRFQFRCDGPEPLEAVAVTMPPWPGAEEAEPMEGIWPATV